MVPFLKINKVLDEKVWLVLRTKESLFHSFFLVYTFLRDIISVETMKGDLEL